MILILSKKVLLRFVAIMVSVLIIMLGVYTINKFALKANSNTKAYIALIIDDFGNDSEGTRAMMDLEIPLTAAVMPFLPNSYSDAEAAYNAGMEVILHIPMEPMHGPKEWLGPRGITTNLSDEEIQQRIKEGLDELKLATGMNNHMGSKATQDKRVMKNILEVAKQRNLIFIDSVTTQNSVVGEVAKNMNVVFFKRDVFLDNSKIKKDIEEQLRELGDIALKKGYAIGIGHVGPEGGTVTAEAIKSVYPELVKNGIRFVCVSELKNIIQ